MSLNDANESIREQTLLMNPLPNERYCKAYCTTARVETQRNGTANYSSGPPDVTTVANRLLYSFFGDG